MGRDKKVGPHAFGERGMETEIYERGPWYRAGAVMRGSVFGVLFTTFVVLASAGCMDPPKPDHDDLDGKVAWLMSAPEVTPVPGREGLWDLAWTIVKITNSYVDEDDPTDQFWWDEMRMKWREMHITCRNDTSMPGKELDPYTEGIRDDGLGFYFEDLSGPGNGPDVGDRIWTTSVNASLAGYLFPVWYEGEWYGGIEKPTELRVPSVLP
jgi:hypothetical protein